MASDVAFARGKKEYRYKTIFLVLCMLRSEKSGLRSGQVRYVERILSLNTRTRKCAHFFCHTCTHTHLAPHDRVTLLFFIAIRRVTSLEWLKRVRYIWNLRPGSRSMANFKDQPPGKTNANNIFCAECSSQEMARRGKCEILWLLLLSKWKNKHWMLRKMK